MNKKRKYLLIWIGLLLATIFCFPYFKVIKEYIALKISGKKTVSDRISELGKIVDNRLFPQFAKMGIQYPPNAIVFIALKSERNFEVYANNPGEKFKKVCSYPILAASGKIGPKLKEGDRQVPEGIYSIESLNPNSLYHLSMKISYPNNFDKKMARFENRSNLGGDIMIHGNQVSIGCIALGDEASEDLFVLAAKTGYEKIKVVISPVDFRKNSLPQNWSPCHVWINDLYKDINDELKIYENEI
jgi:hypothetical protein